LHENGSTSSDSSAANNRASYFGYNPQLSLRLRGTPAALFEVERLIEKNCSVLEDWAIQRGFIGESLDCAADYYNLDFKQRAIYADTVQQNNGDSTGVMEYLTPQFIAMRKYLDNFWNR
jgi:hypothetical protein